jgi:hypothetical protein
MLRFLRYPSYEILKAVGPGKLDLSAGRENQKSSSHRFTKPLNEHIYSNL